ncbi:GntR family transcriptional regulator [Sphingopyxis sp.]|uniref:GntR family transcriptional regulator n=1 Tax=Sphingopyxis sp. TaxID=1908224 RepID=UPI003458570A
MNAGSTMERVYLDLKARLLAGQYPPGTRLDPVQLAKSLRASATPVREALHRLAGERIIDSWHQEGFRPPILAEADLHDLYNWASHLLGLALRSEVPVPDPPAVLVNLASHADYAEALDSLFRAIAMGSANREIRFAIFSLVERSHVFRRAEVRVDPSARELLAAMAADYRFARWSALRAKITRFHRHRMAMAGRVVAELRPRDEPLR